MTLEAENGRLIGTVHSRKGKIMKNNEPKNPLVSIHCLVHLYV